MRNDNINSMKGVKANNMKKYLMIDFNRIKKMLDIKMMVFNKEITPEEARKLVNETFDYVTAEEFAYGEQDLYNAGITDEIMVEGMDDILDVFRDVLQADESKLPQGHPIQTYADESAALQKLLLQMKVQLNKKFIKNEWLELYEKLSQINIHFSRKQHQLFPALERKGFDRPTKIMWTFDDRVRDAIRDAYELLKADMDNKFLEAQENVMHLVRDILEKEKDVLYPTSLKLLSDEDFAEMRISDDEIGYCLIDNPPPYKVATRGSNDKDAQNEKANLISDLQNVLAKHGLSISRQEDEVLDVSTGKLTLEQINLIYKHMQVDLSYVDENEIVKFYTDTKHRVFPRSAGVIGRAVQNCHPRESVAMVEEIIRAFRNGEQDEAEFWLEIGGKFIYIIYNAVRDKQGKFRGVLEMMQDVTHIRSLTGSQRLISWTNDKQKENKNSDTTAVAKNKYEISPKTVIGSLVKQYPYIKEFLVSLSPDFSKLNNPVLFNTMKGVATLEMVSKVGGFEVDDLINRIIQRIDNNQQA